MKSSAAVYNRLEIAAKRHDRRPLYDWLMRRTDNAVRDVIAHGLSMANDPDYRLGIEADRFARREYAEAFDGFLGLGRKGDRYRALIEGALRLRAGIDTDTRRESTRREVERLLGVMRAEIDALRAPALPGGFDSFDDDEEEPAATWQDTARMALTAKMGEGEVTPVSSFLRDGETLAGVESLAYRFDTRVSVHELDRVVLLFAPSAGSEATADKIVAAFRRKLVPRTKATNAAWFAHLARIVVVGPAGSWNFDAEPDSARAPRLRGEGDTVTAQKERLIAEAQQAFGRGVMISGNTEKGYTLHISPTTKKHKWAAASLRFGHDFDNAHRQLAEAIRRVSEKIPQQFPVQGFAASTLDAEADGQRDFPTGTPEARTTPRSAPSCAPTRLASARRWSSRARTRTP